MVLIINFLKLNQEPKFVGFPHFRVSKVKIVSNKFLCAWFSTLFLSCITELGTQCIFCYKFLDLKKLVLFML